MGVGVNRASQVNEVICSQETQEIENEKYERREKKGLLKQKWKIKNHHS